MPKTMNIKKAASAMNQNQKKIKAALEGAEVTFASVEKSLGRAQFQLKLTGQKIALGAPRGLFTAGTMRISAGQIVIVEGSSGLGYEIVARIDNLSVAQKLVKMGAMPADILTSATVAGALTTVEEKEDDLFDYSAEDAGNSFEPSLKGGVKNARKQQESQALASALANRLGNKLGKTIGVRVEDACDLSYLDDDVEKKIRAKKPAKPVEIKTDTTNVSDMSGIWGGGIDEELVTKPQVFEKVPVSWEDEIDIDSI